MVPVDQLLGAVLGDQAGLVEPDLLQRPLDQLLDPHPLLGAGHLVAVHRIDELVVLAGQVAQPRPHQQELLLALAACGLGERPRLGSKVHRDLQPGQDRRHRDPDRMRGQTLTDQPFATFDRPGSGLPLGLRRTHQPVRAAVEGTRALLAGAQRQSRVGLGLSRGTCRVREAFALGRVRLVVGGLVGVGQSLLEVGKPSEVRVARLLRGDDRRGDALGLRAGSAGLGAEVPELLGDRGQGRVRLVKLGQGDVDPALGVEPLGLEPGDVEREPLARGDRPGQLARGVVVRRLDLEQARLRRGAAGREVGRVHVAVPGDRGQVGQVGDQCPCGGEVVDDRGLEQHPGDGGGEAVRAAHHVDGVRRMGRQPRPVAVGGRGTEEQHPGTTQVAVLEVPDRGDGRVRAGHRDRVGRRAERGGQRRLVARIDGEYRGNRAHQSGDRLGRRRAVPRRRPCG